MAHSTYFSAANGMATILLFIFNFAAIWCCQSDVDIYEETTVLPEYEILDRKDDLKRNLPGAWGGFSPPTGLQAKWRDWLDNYKKQLEMEHQASGSNFKDRDSSHGWPHSWQGIGPGHGGGGYPPWAYAPINVGLPAFCYKPPHKGNCAQELKRWAFNPYLAECVEFSYSGCGENQNNFKEKLKCEESCMKMPISGCDPDTKMSYINQ